MSSEKDKIQITVCDSKQYTDIPGQHLYDPLESDLKAAVKVALKRSADNIIFVHFNIIFVHLTAHGDKYVMHPKLATELTNYQLLDEFNVSYTLPEG